MAICHNCSQVWAVSVKEPGVCDSVTKCWFIFCPMNWGFFPQKRFVVQWVYLGLSMPNPGKVLEHVLPTHTATMSNQSFRLNAAACGIYHFNSKFC